MAFFVPVVYALGGMLIRVAAKKVAELCQRELDLRQPVRYIVFYNEAWGRWVGAIDISEIQTRADFKGGYLGIASYYNFYSY